jgi:hypothetical protein
MATLPKTWGYKSNDASTAGILDFAYCVNGNFVAIEDKRSLTDAKNSKSTPLQMENCKQIIDAGGVAVMVVPQTWPRVFKLLKELSTTQTLRRVKQLRVQLMRASLVSLSCSTPSLKQQPKL